MGALQLRRGLKANLAVAAVTAAAGEPLVATDTRELYIGSGAGTVYKVSDVVFSNVTPPLEDGKIWVNTADNEIYRYDADTSAWLVMSKSGQTITIDTDITLGGLTPSDLVISSQKAIKAYVDNSVAAIKIPQEWPDSVLDEVADPPALPVAGDRYLIKAPATGAFLGKETQIAEYDGTAWVFKVPTTGTFVNVDTYTTGLYYFGGAAWSKKSFELTTVGAGLTIANGKIDIDPAIAGTGLSWEATTGVLSVGVLDGGTF